MSYVTIQGLDVKVLDIQLDPQLNRPTKAIVGANGSHTNYQGMGGRLITLSVFATNSDYNNFQTLYNYGDKVSLISQSAAQYNGLYHITNFTSDEYQPGRFKISMKLQEDFVFNITRMDFVTYDVKPSQPGNEIVVGEKWNISATGNQGA